MNRFLTAASVMPLVFLTSTAFSKNLSCSFYEIGAAPGMKAWDESKISPQSKPLKPIGVSDFIISELGKINPSIKYEAWTDSKGNVYASIQLIHSQNTQDNGSFLVI